MEDHVVSKNYLYSGFPALEYSMGSIWFVHVVRAHWKCMAHTNHMLPWNIRTQWKSTFPFLKGERVQNMVNVNDHVRMGSRVSNSQVELVMSKKLGRTWATCEWEWFGWLPPNEGAWVGALQCRMWNIQEGVFSNASVGLSCLSVHYPLPKII